MEGFPPLESLQYSLKGLLRSAGPLEPITHRGQAFLTKYPVKLPVNSDPQESGGIRRKNVNTSATSR